jgi:DNA-binding NarL/FixJ family response regulator
MLETILIVEDHESVRRALRDWLAVSFPQLRVIEAASAEEAIFLIRSETPHLIIIDFKLPGMNGIEATRRIKSSLPSAQIVMLTIREDDIYRAYATAAGVSAYIPKRAIPTALHPTLAALLSNAETWQ